MRKSFLFAVLLALAFAFVIVPRGLGLQDAHASVIQSAVLQSGGADGDVAKDNTMSKQSTTTIGGWGGMGGMGCVGGSGSMISAIDGGGCCIAGAVSTIDLIEPTGHSEPLVSEKGYIFVKFDERIFKTTSGVIASKIEWGMPYGQGGVTFVTERVLTGTSNALYVKGPALIASSA